MPSLGPTRGRGLFAGAPLSGCQPKHWSAPNTAAAFASLRAAASAFNVRAEVAGSDAAMLEALGPDVVERLDAAGAFSAAPSHSELLERSLEDISFFLGPLPDRLLFTLRVVGLSADDEPTDDELEATPPAPPAPQADPPLSALASAR